MPRKTSTAPTRVWKFGACAPVSNGELMREHLWLARRFYNALIENERHRQDRFREYRRHYAPEYRAADDECERLEAELTSLYDEVRSGRRETFVRSKEKRLDLTPEQAARVEELKTRRAAAWKIRSAASAKFLKSFEAERVQFREAVAARKPTNHEMAEVKANVLAEMAAGGASEAWVMIETSEQHARDVVREKRGECGVSHGTYIATEAAAARAAKDTLGPPSFKSFDGGGKVGTQLMKRAGVDVTWGDIVDGKSNSFRLRPSPKRGTGKSGNDELYWEAWVRIGSESDKSPIWTKLPVKLHRQPPREAVVKWAYVVVRREGQRFRHELQVTMEHESFAEPKRPAGVGDGGHVQIGWAQTSEGICVATHADGEVVVPNRLLFGVHDGERKRSGAHDAHLLRGFADDHLNEFKAEMTATIGQPRDLLRLVNPEATEGDIERTPERWSWLLSDKKRGWLVSLVWQWCNKTIGEERTKELWGEWKAKRFAVVGADLFSTRERCEEVMGKQLTKDEHLAFWSYTWAKKEVHLRQVSVDMQRKFEARRDALFRAEAIRIATKWETITVDKYSVADLKKQPELKTRENRKSETSQQNLQFAAPGRFREVLIEVMGERCTKAKRPESAESKPTKSRAKRARREEPQAAE